MGTSMPESWLRNNLTNRGYSFHCFLRQYDMKLKSAFLLAGLLLYGTIFSQTTNGIKKVYAYYEEHMPGNIPVGEDGKPMKKYPTITHHLFVETTSKTKIQWKVAWKDGKSYSVSAKEITEFPVALGKEKVNEKEVKI